VLYMCVVCVCVQTGMCVCVTNIRVCVCVCADGEVLGIREHLIDELDYILLPAAGWNKLLSWYGLREGQHPIARKVHTSQQITHTHPSTPV